MLPTELAGLGRRSCLRVLPSDAGQAAHSRPFVKWVTVVGWHAVRMFNYKEWCDSVDVVCLDIQLARCAVRPTLSFEELWLCEARWRPVV